jgi:apolipoprotein N-acyltransferase
MRAIETRRSIARCANTGISSFIDPYGRVSQRSRLFRQAVLVGDVKVTQRQTFFVRHGNLFSQFTSLLSVLVVLFAIAKGTSKRGYR